MQSKRCWKCGEVKLAQSYSRARNRKSGLQSKCKECDRTYREAHREEIRDYNRAYREEHRDELSAHYRAYREEHRDELAEIERKRLFETQSASREVATRNGEPWTPAEDRVALTSEGTLLEIALTLGRTTTSVRSRRKRLRRKAVTA